VVLVGRPDVGQLALACRCRADRVEVAAKEVDESDPLDVSLKEDGSAQELAIWRGGTPGRERIRPS